MNLLRRFFQLTLSLWLAGCGPGVGGSGTGEPAQAVADFGAMAAPVCGAAFASSLNCPANTGAPSAPSPAAAGTAPLTFVDVATGGQTSATLQANGIDLQARCQHLRFSGEWAVDGAGEARFYGTVTEETSGLRQLASLSVAEAEGGLQVLLRAFDGSVVLGPVVLRPQTAVAEPPAACP